MVILSFDIRICFGFRISTCPPLPEMPAPKLNAVPGVGRRVFGFCLNMTFRSDTIYHHKVNFNKWSHRLAVRTPASHAGNRGSIPLGITKQHFYYFRHCLAGFAIYDYVRKLVTWGLADVYDNQSCACFFCIYRHKSCRVNCK